MARFEYRGDRSHGHAAAHPPPLDGKAARLPESAGPGVGQRGACGREQVCTDYDGLSPVGPGGLAGTGETH